MKKLIFLITISLFLGSCGVTHPSKDTEMLQEQYLTVYPLTPVRYICIDSTNSIYDINVNFDGTIQSKVKIK